MARACGFAAAIGLAVALQVILGLTLQASRVQAGPLPIAVFTICAHGSGEMPEAPPRGHATVCDCCPAGCCGAALPLRAQAGSQAHARPPAQACVATATQQRLRDFLSDQTHRPRSPPRPA